MAQKLNQSDTLPLIHGGGRIPIYGLGVWDSKPTVCEDTVKTALRLGYRQIDTAQGYKNEKEVGEGVKASGVPRKDIFITTKIAGSAGSPEKTYAQCERSVELLGGYADLFLIHTPSGGPDGIQEMWQALEKLQQAGKVKALGVSNFNAKQIDAMQKYATVWPPAVNQLELHPWLQQREAVDYCHQHKIVLQAYCPLVRAQKVEDSHLLRVAKSTGTSTGQVLVRYSLQKGWVPLPKSDKEHRIKENADLFGFEISEEDMKSLDQREEEDGKVCLCDQEVALW